jgi:hypothetical protein
MAVCHAGHDVQLLGYGRSFCDCGAGSCSLSLQSQELAERCLVGNTRNSMGLDEEGRVLGTKESNLVITPFEVKHFNIISNSSSAPLLRSQLNTLSESSFIYWSETSCQNNVQ